MCCVMLVLQREAHPEPRSVSDENVSVQTVSETEDTFAERGHFLLCL